jgi:hypothetical protein
MAYLSVHIQENQHRMADRQLPFTPHYIVALSKNGSEVQRYIVPQGLYPGLLVVGNSTIYLAGEATINYGDFHSIFTGIVVIVFFIASTVASVLDATGALPNSPTGLLQRIAIIIGWGWVVLLAIRLLGKGNPYL